MNERLRIATYNIHKCRGIDGRTRPERIARVIREVDADVVALQEVLHGDSGFAEFDQLRELVRTLDGYDVQFGETRLHGTHPYGNAVLSRVPVLATRTYDLTWKGRERRGCMRVDVSPRGEPLHIFNVHLGTSYFERPHQARQLLSSHVLTAEELTGPRVVVGDFNEWTRGIASKLMHGHFGSVDHKLHRARRRTFPGFLPLLHLDHFYFDTRLKLAHFAVHRSRTALVASDHLPIYADFEV